MIELMTTFQPLMAFAERKGPDVSAHLGTATNLGLAIIALAAVFFLVRPELWRRLFFDRVDPRPAALLRIALCFVVLWSFADLLMPTPPLEHSTARFLFTDEGLWLTEMARKNYGGSTQTLWDPEQGLQHWYDVFPLVWGKFSVLHLRSDPSFAFTLYGLMLASLGLVIVGLWTRTMTVVAWVLVETMYAYSPVFYTGGDTVIRVFMFLGMFVRWGEAYSLDSWRRRGKAILSGVTHVPAPATIPAWPLRLMMLQLTIIYTATGMLKSGVTWMDGTALYYALNLDHFYRWPQTEIVAWGQRLGILPVMTVFVHWWEVLFPVALVGAAVNAYERERRAGVWPQAAAWRRWLSYALVAAAFGCGAYIAGLGAFYYIPQKFSRLPLAQVRWIVTGAAAGLVLVLVGLYHLTRAKAPRVFDFVRHWLLGKRFWLVFGFGMHIGIDISMNVGTFAQVMMAVYFAWLSGDEIDAFWRYLVSRPLAPGEGARPVRRAGWQRYLLSPLDRLRYRTRKEPLVVLHHPDDASVRRVALLRLWDVGERLAFEANEDVPAQRLVVRDPVRQTPVQGRAAASALVRVLPGLWWLAPVRALAPNVAGRVAAAVLRQKT